MKTLSMLLCLLLCIFGLLIVILESNLAGAVLLCLGGLAFVIIAHKTDKISGYDKNHWMNW